MQNLNITLDKEQKHLLLSILLLIISLYLQACADLPTEQTDGAQYKTSLSKTDSTNDMHQLNYPETYIEKEFGLANPIGDLILAESQRWEIGQLDQADVYAQPRMCAHNVSKVLELSDLPYYSDYLVPNMTAAVKVRGGLVTQLDTRDKQGFVQSVNQLFGGHLPIGTLVNGCLYQDCSGEGGDGHIAILGETDENGIVYLYHNNWYRPDNEGGVRKDFMVSEYYYDDLGLRRQWMKTPWIRIHRDHSSDEIVDIEGLLPAIDDLDPYTGFFLTVSVIPEILESLSLLDREQFFCPEGLTADPMLGACTDEDNVYGRFPQKMIESCIEQGFGSACSEEYQLSGNRYQIAVQRWSKDVYRHLRGLQACPQGTKIDHDLGYCVQTLEDEAKDAFGPFPKTIVERCFDWGGGNACASGRMSTSFLKDLIK